MEFLLAIPVILIPFFFPVLGGLMAKCFGRSYWFWFWLSVPLPMISQIILLCLPDKSKQRGDIKQELLGTRPLP